MRVAIACAFHESNTFAGGLTTRSDFTSWRHGDEVLGLAGTQTATGGFIDACERRGWQAVPALHAWATPSAPVARETFAELCDDLAAALERCGEVDALLLELHGAMVAEGTEAADLQLARAARRAVGDVPIALVLDPHANFAHGITEQVDVVTAYQNNPHTDMADAAERAAALLERILAGGGTARPDLASAGCPVIALPIAQNSSHEPLRSILARASELGRSPGIWDATVLFGFAYSDVPELGMTFLVTAEDGQVATAAAAELADFAWSRREGFQRRLPGPAEAVSQAEAAGRFTVLADTGDNIGGGAAGDQTALLDQLIASGKLRFATTVADPGAVREAVAAGVGADVELRLGRPEMAVTAKVVRTGPGRYVNRGPLSRGAEFDPGETAVLSLGPDRHLVVHSRPVMANDQNIFRSCGIDPGTLDVVALKGAAAIRAGWQDRDPLFIDVDSPGVTPSSFAHLTYENVRRPIYPLNAGMARDDLSRRP